MHERLCQNSHAILSCFHKYSVQVACGVGERGLNVSQAGRYAAGQVGDTVDTDQTLKDIKAQIAAAKQSVTQAANDYQSTLKPQLNNLTRCVSSQTSKTAD